MRGGPSRSSIAAIAIACLSLWAALAVTGGVAAQSGRIVLNSPTPGASFAPGDQIVVFGRVIELEGAPIGNVTVVAQIVDNAGATVAEASVLSDLRDGSFVISLRVPHTLVAGLYMMEVSSPDPAVQGVQVSLRIRGLPGESPPYALALAGAVLAVSVVAAVVVLVSLRPRRRRPPQAHVTRFGKPKR